MVATPGPDGTGATSTICDDCSATANFVHGVAQLTLTLTLTLTLAQTLSLSLTPSLTLTVTKAAMPAQGHGAAAAQPSATPISTPISQAEIDLEAPASIAGEKSIRLDLDDVNGEV